MPLWFPLPVALSFLISLSLTPLIILLARYFLVVDEPKGGRKIHLQSVPLLGGLAIYGAIALTVVLILFTSTFLTAGEIDNKHLLGFVLSGFLLMIGGIIDDRFSLPPRYSFVFPVLAILLATLSGLGVEKVTNPLGGFVVLLPVVSAVFTFCWLFVMTYTTKLLDGVDGLAGSVSLLGTLMIALLALSERYYQPDVVLLSAVLGAAITGFLLWNIYPARIFLGEGGSTFLGFSLGVLGVVAGSKIMTLLLVLGVPALDLFLVMCRRLYSGKSIFAADRNHLHHLLFDNGLSQRQVVLVYVGLCGLFGITTLIFTAFQKLLALSLLAVLVVALIFFLEKRRAAYV